MTITNLPTYSQQQYLSTQHHYHHLNSTASGHAHHSHVHPAHPHIHHPQHPYTGHAGLSHTQHVLAGPIRTEPVTRKRPKYTRSKTGCLTCRVKKIKCDETKPTCTRCSHGQRECNWPENVPTRKKPAPKKGSEQSEEQSPPAEQQSTASTSSVREDSPARRSPLENLVSSGSAVSSRRNTSEPNTAAGSPMVSPIDPPPPLSRRPSLQTGPSVAYSSNPQLRAQFSHSITPPTVSPVSFHPSPSSPQDYHSYNGSPASNGHNGHSAGLTRHELPALQTGQSRISGMAVDNNNGMNSWQASPMLQGDSLEPSFYRHLQERNLVGRSSTSYAS